MSHFECDLYGFLGSSLGANCIRLISVTAYSDRKRVTALYIEVGLSSQLPKFGMPSLSL